MDDFPEDFLRTSGRSLLQSTMLANPSYTNPFEDAVENLTGKLHDKIRRFLKIDQKSPAPLSSPLAAAYIVPEAATFGLAGEFWCNPALGLADAGYGYCYTNFSNGQLLLAPESVGVWLESHGSKAEKVGVKS